MFSEQSEFFRLFLKFGLENSLYCDSAMTVDSSLRQSGGGFILIAVLSKTVTAMIINIFHVFIGKKNYSYQTNIVCV